MILDILFWLFFVIACVSNVSSAPAPFTRYAGVYVLICVGILGFKVVSLGTLR